MVAKQVMSPSRTAQRSKPVQLPTTRSSATTPTASMPNPLEVVAEAVAVPCKPAFLVVEKLLSQQGSTSEEPVALATPLDQ